VQSIGELRTIEPLKQPMSESLKDIATHFEDLNIRLRTRPYKPWDRWWLSADMSFEKSGFPWALSLRSQPTGRSD